MNPGWIGFAAVAGVALGPPLRAAALRYTVRFGLPWRAMACPECGHSLRRPRWPRWPSTWALARSRCPECHTRIGPPPLLIELVAAVLFAALAFRAPGPLRLAAWCAVAAAGIVLWQVDLAVQRLPDQLTIPAFLAATALSAGAGLALGEPGKAAATIGGGAGLAAGYLLLFVVYPAGIGLGDAKLALSLGAVLGWYGWLVILFSAAVTFLLCGIVSAGLLALGAVGRKDVLPHGPFMLLGTLATVLALG